jgi:HSP20 family protein
MMTLREAMDRLFDDAFTSPLSLGRASAVPAIDMYQTEAEVVVKAAIPGFKADDVQINITGEVLSIRGESRQENETREKTWQMREQRWGTFERRVVLPTLVKANDARAEFEDGILTITLPKAEESRPKTISIKARKS